MIPALLNRMVGSVVAGATFDPATVLNAALSGGNLTATQSGANGGAHVFDTSAKTSGKYYFEITYVVLAGTINGGNIGVAPVGTTYPNIASETGCAVALTNGQLFGGGVAVYNNGSRSQGDVIAIAVDLDNRTIWWKKVSGTPGNWNGNVANGDPATNLNGIAVNAGSIVPYVGFGTNPSDVYTGNFGGSAFVGTVPTGFTAGWPA